MPLTFSAVQSLFDKARTSGLPDMPLEDFARYGYQATGDPILAQIAQASPWQNKIRSINSWVDEKVRSTGADEAIGGATGSLFEALGATRATGEEVGRDFPRMVLDALPMLAGGGIGFLVGGPPGAAAGAKIGMGASGALGALNAYGDTGEVLPAAIAGAAPALGNALFKGGSTMALNAAAKEGSLLSKLGFSGGTPRTVTTMTEPLGGMAPIGSTLTGRALDTVPDKILSYLGGQAAVQGGFMGLDVLQQGPEILFNKDYLLANLVGNVPFLGLDVMNFVGKPWIGDPTFNLPPKAPDIRTEPEQRALNFHLELERMSTEAEKALAKNRLGFDIASKVLSADRMVAINERYKTSAEIALGELTANWEKLRSDPAFAGLPPLAEALQNPSVIKDYPGAAGLMEQHGKRMKIVEAEKREGLKRSSGNYTVETLFGVAVDELKLPETVLSKPVEERAVADYEAVLKGRLSDDAIKIIRDQHRVQAGLEAECPALWKDLQGKTTKASKAKGKDKRVEAAAAVVKGKGGKVDDEELVNVAKKAKAEGKSDQEAAAAVVQHVVNKAKKATRTKAPAGRKPGQTENTKQVVGVTRAKVNEALEKLGAARLSSDEALKQFPEESALQNAALEISEADMGDAALSDRLYNMLGRVWENSKNSSPAERFQKFRRTIATVVENYKRSQKTVPLKEEMGKPGKKKPGLEDEEEGKQEAVTKAVEEEVVREEKKDDEEETVSRSAEEEEDADVVDREDVAEEAVEQVEETDDGLAPLESKTETEEDAQKAAAKAVKVHEAELQLAERLLKLGLNDPDLDPKDKAKIIEKLNKKIASLPEAQRQKLRVQAALLADVKLAGTGLPVFKNVQDLLTLEEYSDLILSRLGYDETERPALVQSFVEMARMFESPEVRYGDLFGEGPSGAKFAALQAYHETPYKFDVRNARPWTHFGPKEAAEAVWKNWKKDVWDGPADPKLTLNDVVLEIKNPLRLEENDSTTGPEGWAWVAAEKLKALGKEISPGHSPESVRKDLQKAGYDSIVYDNLGEGGGDSYIILDKSQVTKVNEVVKKAQGEARLASGKKPKFQFRLYENFRRAGAQVMNGLVVGKDGTVPLQAILAKVKKYGVSEFEAQAISDLAVGLAKDGRVKVEEIARELENVATVEVNELGLQNNHPSVLREAELNHKLDTLDPDWGEKYVQWALDPVKARKDHGDEIVSLLEQVRDVQYEAHKHKTSKAATGKYGVDPYSIEQLQGKVEVAKGQKIVWSGDLSLNIPLEFVANEPMITGRQDDRPVPAPRFRSQHYDIETGANQLAFARGAIHEYQPGAKLPDGTIATKVERVMEVWGMQSDWASKVKRLEESGEKLVTSGNEQWARENGIQDPREKLKEISHPLLPYWESLALKAAVDFAKRQGASRLYVTDAESAMMTEGHDQAVNNDPIFQGTEDQLRDYVRRNNITKEVVEQRGLMFANEVDAQGNETGIHKLVYRAPQRPSQEPGMRAAYDERIPNILSKLLGQKGQKAEMGVHDKVEAQHELLLTERPRREDFSERINELKIKYPYGEYEVREGSRDFDTIEVFKRFKGSPVFKDSQNRPKTQNTGLSYDLNTYLAQNSDFLRLASTERGPVYAAALEKFGQIFFNPEHLAALPKEQRPKLFASLLAHENSHILTFKARKGDFGPAAQKLIADYEGWVRTASPLDVHDVVDVMSEVWLSKETRDLPGVKDVIKNLRDKAGQMDTDEVLANMLGIYASGMREGSARRGEFFTLLPAVVRKAFDWIGSKLQGVWNGVEAWVKLGFDAEKTARANGIAEVFAEVRRGAREAEKNLGELERFAGLADPGFPFEYQLDELKFAKGEYGTSGKPKQRVEETLNNWVYRGANLARMYPFIADAFHSMVDVQKRVSASIVKALVPVYGTPSYTGKMKVVKGGPWDVVNRSHSLSKLAQKINIHANKEGFSVAVVDPATGTVSFDTKKLTPELRGELNQFSPEGQKALAQLMIQRENSLREVQKVIVEQETGKLEASLWNVIRAGESMVGKHGQAKEIAKEIMAAMKSGDRVKLVEAVSKITDPAEQQTALKTAEIFNRSMGDLEKFYADRPWFGSLRRFKAIKQYFTPPDGEAQLMNFGSAKEAEAEKARLVREGWKAGHIISTAESTKKDYSLDERLLDMIQAREAEILELYKSLPLPEDVRKELIENLDISEKIVTAKAAESVYSPEVKRNFKPGGEELNMLEQDLLYANAAIRQSHMKRLHAEIQVERRNPEWAQYVSVKETFDKLYENFRTPSSGFLKGLSKANAAWFIGFNLPGHMAELFQPVMSHLPELRAMGVGLFEGLGVIKGAQGEIGKIYAKALGDKAIKGKKEIHLWDYAADPQEAEMLKVLLPEVDQNPLAGAYEDIGFSQGQIASISRGEKGKSYGELVAAPANWLGNTGLQIYSKFTQHNTLVALLSGYRVSRKQGQEHAAAMESAKRFERTVNMGGGKASRQAGPFSGNAILGHVFYALQGYTTGWFSQLATYYRHGFKSADFKDVLTPKQMTDARKAFKTMILAQLGTAGLMGFPFVAAGITLMEELLGEDLRGQMYEAIDSATGDQVIGEAATHGVAASLGEALGKSVGVPVDLHGRFTLGGLGGFNTYSGYSAASLLGPTASMVNGLWNMGKTFAQEKDPRAAMAAGGPSGLRNVAKALGEELEGREGEEVGWVDRLAQGAGFRTTEQRREREMTKIATMRDEKAQRSLALGAQRVIQAIQFGTEKANQVLIAEANKLLQDVDPLVYPSLLEETKKALANKAATLVVDKTFPRDLRELGSARVAPTLGPTAAALGVALPPSQEVEREMTRLAVLQAMGVPYRGSMRQAARRDYQAELEPLGFR